VSSDRTIRRLIPAVALLLACGGDDLLLPGQGEPAAVEIAGGNAQSGRVGMPLAAPVVALVTDAQERPVVGVPVAFAFTGATDASVAPDTATTNADGRASFQLAMGTHVGSATAEVRVTTAGGKRTLSAPVQFTAVSSDANELLLVAGDAQSAPAGAPLADPLVVQVTDAFANPIPGVPITWSADAGGSLSQTTTPTGEDGLASVELTLGPGAGIQHTTASAPGLAGSPVSFTHTALAGAATILEAVSGDGQHALVGTSLPDPLVVRARDAAGNPVEGLPVAWVVGTGGGSPAPQTSKTDGQGLATTLWTLGPGEGQNTLTAVVSGVGTVGFTAMADPGTPPGLSLEVQPPATAARGVALSPRPLVQLREPDGAVRHKGGVAVSVALVAGGGTLRGALTRNTGADGRVEFRDLAIEGPPGSYVLAFSATGYSGATSSAIALTRAPTATTVLSDDPDPSVAGAPVRVRFRVQSPGGTPSGSVRVTSDDGASCSGSIAAGECTLAPATAGGRTLTVAYAGDTEFEGSSATEAHTVTTPAPTATTTTITSDKPDPSDVGQPVAVNFTVTASAGTPTGSVTVAASGGETCSASVAEGTCTLTLVTPGDRTLTVTYAGADGFAGSGDTETHVIRTPPAAPSATASTVVARDAAIGLGEKTEITVHVVDASGAALEHVIVTLAATGTGNTIAPASANTNKDGQVKFSFSAATAGARTFTAVAGGVTLAQQPVVTVGQATTSTSITSDQNDPSAPGETITVRFEVKSDAGTPTGDVSVSATGGTTCGATVAVGSCDLVINEAGTQTITATYAGDGNFAGSSGTASHVVAAPRLVMRHQPSHDATSGIQLKEQPELELRDAGDHPLNQQGVAVTASLVPATATLSGTLTQTTDGEGRVKFTDLSITGAPGSYTIQFTAAGFASATSEPIDLQLAPSKTSITSDENDPSTAGQEVTVQFSVTSDAGTPTGTVAVTSDGGESCSASVEQGSCPITFAAAGDWTLTASYGGDATFAPSSGTESHHVDEATVGASDVVAGFGGGASR
jgi:5-hydroxyisourate hydrolase-like protein (transthyretin family)